jgi:hypothetical protein
MHPATSHPKGGVDMLTSVPVEDRAPNIDTVGEFKIGDNRRNPKGKEQQR